MNYEVEIVREGRGGWVYYREDGLTLPFDWDITADGFEVYLTPSAEWPQFCEKNKAPQCLERRSEIVTRIADEVYRKKAKKAKVEIDDNGIVYTHQGWLHSFVSWILGV